jgi:hypothetical protein
MFREHVCRCCALLRLVSRILEEQRDDPTFKGIVFVQQTTLTFPVARLLTTHLVVITILINNEHA